MKRILFIIFACSLFLNQALAKKELLFYIGITMVQPIQELANLFEKDCDCTIKILQGGSQDLYESIKMSQTGDLYLPGSISYCDRYKPEGLLIEHVKVGYNRASMMVKRGNPLGIKGDLSALSNPQYKVVLGNLESGSIGSATKRILTSFGNYEEALLNSVYLAPDSRNLIRALKDGDADLILNWHATSFWPENKDAVEALILPQNQSPKSALALTLLKTSQYPELAKKFMDFAISPKGRDVFQSYGFITPSEREEFDKASQ